MILVFAAWAAAANAFAADAGNPDLGVSWSSLLAGPTRAELEQALSKPFANPYDARKPGHPPRSVRTCAELLSLPEGHTAAGTEADFRGFKAQRVRCRAIKILLAAKPARQSHLDGFAASNDDVFAQLPAAMIPAASPEAAAVVEKAARAGSSWGARDREMKIVGVRGDRVVAESLTSHANLTILGRADLDGDGLLDVIIERVGTARDARWSVTEAFVLTRRKPGGKLEVVAKVN